MSGPEAVAALMFFGGAFWVLRPIAGALAKRIGGEGPPAPKVEPDEAVLAELQRLRDDVSELAERLDFTERLLAKQRDAPRLASPEGR
jgi:ubiquinone biosynthesis protein UbiJ